MLNNRQLLDNLSSAVLAVDKDLVLRYLNSAAENLLAASSARTCGQHLSALVRESASAEEALRAALASGQKYTVRGAQWRLHNLQSYTVDYSVNPLPELGLILLEVQLMDRLLRIARENTLLSAQQTTRNLMRGIAHEVKNPLGGIRGAAQLLQRELGSGELAEYTEIIIAEADRLRRLVDRMLGPRKPLDLQLANVHQAVERVAQLIEAECKGTVVISRDYDPSIPDFRLDSAQLIQALLNILRNAMQAVAESIGLAAGKLVLRTRIQRQFTIGQRNCPLVCRIDVQDNGPGIPAEIREEMFFPMISARAQGAGLGLSIAQHIINQHRGIIHCESVPGQTCLQIYLPLQTE